MKAEERSGFFSIRFGKAEKTCGAGVTVRILAALVNAFGYHNPCYV
jgi:hypothetical protein